MKFDFTAKCNKCDWVQTRQNVNRRGVNELMGLWFAHASGKEHEGFLHVVNVPQKLPEDFKKALYPGGLA